MCTYKSKLYGFINVMVAPLFEDLDAHERVVVKDRSWVVAVGPDSPDASREMDNQVRPLVPVHPVNVSLLGQVVLGAREREWVGSERLDQSDHLPAEEAFSTRHRDAP